jgi:hypothetical protein
MLLPWGKIALLFGIVLVGVVCALELWRWSHGGGLLTRGQLARRLFVGFLLQVAMAMALVGEIATETMPWQNVMLYWSICLFAAVIALFGALRDWASINRQYRQRRAELFRDIARLSSQDRNPPQPG